MDAVQTPAPKQMTSYDWRTKIIDTFSFSTENDHSERYLDFRLNFQRS